jgi:hypothetical protein
MYLLFLDCSACLQARFFSIAVYTNKGGDFQYPTPTGNISSGISDYQIVPDAGSSKPWNTAGAAPGGSFTVTVT